MAQRIQPMMGGGSNYAQLAMPAAMAQRGNEGMNLPNEGMPNAMDGGLVPKVAVNPQLQTVSNYNAQSIDQNLLTSGYQQQAAVAGQLRTQSAELSNAQYKAQIDLNTNLANIIQNPSFVPSQGAGIMRLQEQMGSPEGKQAFLNDMEINVDMYQKALENGMTS